MKILVYSNEMSWNELISGTANIEWIRAETVDSFTKKDDIDAYFNLSETLVHPGYSSFDRPVFINSVPAILKKITTAENVTRINGWNGFLKRNSWEVAGKLTGENLTIIKALNKNAVAVPDEPGFIAARIISMIINEAYFAKGEHVSSEKEIDVAMKLGTNYPYGPFEWAKIIGIKNIYALLKILSETDAKYKPSPLLEQEAMRPL